MRDLMAERNIAMIQDGISGDVHEIYYRSPRPEEIAAYQTGMFQRKGNNLVSRVAQQRMKWGGKIITGFRKGTIGADGKVIASDPNDPDYRSDWMELLKKGMPDVVMAVATAAFDRTEVTQEEPDEDPLDG